MRDRRDHRQRKEVTPNGDPAKSSPFILDVTAVKAAFWFSRNAKGPTQGEMLQKGTEENANIGPMGEPMGWDDDLKPPRDPEVPS